ncbi:S-layer family protein [Tolypothrix campylonemoides VB511288]|nr:S-layer family protein [Tolypothrix campylonemoides VB511288]
MKKWTLHFWIAIGLVYLCFLAKTDMAQAQITSDGTLSTQVQTTNNLDFTITNGNRVGNNLFHSFREFSVPTQGAASFSNEPDVQNIISRVTGSSISNIDGLLKTNGSANLFLINPNGIIFGPNASLNINGSFVTSTASHLLFADGTQFSATNPQTPPLLTVSVPIGLQFGQITKPIQVEGSKLRVSPAKTLAMLGGDVLIKGGELTAPQGRIELGSVTSDSLVSLTPIAEGWALGYADVPNFRDIRVSQAAFIDTTGEGNGAIQLRGREIAITGGSVVGGLTKGAEPGQPLVIKASESVEVSGFSPSFYSYLRNFTEGTGSASDIIIATRRLIIRERGIIETSTLGSGRGGNITVDASESVEVLGTEFYTVLGTRSFSPNKDAGNAGTVQISTRKLFLRDGGLISSSTFGAGNGGTLRVDASESVEASGRVVLGTNLPSGLFAESRRPPGGTSTTGNGGDIIINTQRFVVQDGASISVGSLDGSTGQAGKLDINAPGSVTVSGTGIDRNGQVVPSRLLAATESSGSAGDLRVNTGKLTVQDGAAVSVSSTGSGTAGNLEITAGNLLLNNKGTITAETTGGQGNINLRSNGLILRRGSNITTDAKGSNVIGGNININTGVLAAFENSDISANSADFRGGQVRIKTESILGTQFRNAPTLESDITATGASPELSGTVDINTYNIDLSRGLINLPVEPDEPKLAQSCADVAQNQSEFIITGRGGLPPNPREVLKSHPVYVDWVSLDTDAENRVRSDESREEQRQTSRRNNPQDAKSAHPVENEIVEAQGWVVDKNGDVILVAHAPTATPHSSTLNPVSCSTSSTSGG